MFTALMSLALVAVVGVAGVFFSQKMDEMLSHDAPAPAGQQPR
ncbi:hypothetical protein BH11PSE9_BH11PSE9_23830 [soil metagenome]